MANIFEAKIGCENLDAAVMLCIARFHTQGFFPKHPFVIVKATWQGGKRADIAVFADGTAIANKTVMFDKKATRCMPKDKYNLELCRFLFKFFQRNLAALAVGMLNSQSGKTEIFVSPYDLWQFVVATRPKQYVIDPKGTTVQNSEVADQLAMVLKVAVDFSFPDRKIVHKYHHDVKKETLVLYVDSDFAIPETQC